MWHLQALVNARIGRFDRRRPLTFRLDFVRFITFCSTFFHCRLKHRDALKGHMLRHVQGPQKCKICGHISPNRKALGKHNHSHNPQRKERFKCTTCGKGCRDKISLLVNFPHYQIIFWLLRDHFNWRFILFDRQEHSHIHTGFAGSYHCEDCGKTFRFSSSFCLHKKKMHPK